MDRVLVRRYFNCRVYGSCWVDERSCLSLYHNDVRTFRLSILRGKPIFLSLVFFSPFPFSSPLLLQSDTSTRHFNKLLARTDGSSLIRGVWSSRQVIVSTCYRTTTTSINNSIIVTPPQQPQPSSSPSTTTTTAATTKTQTW